jgi:hypothetical protein
MREVTECVKETNFILYVDANGQSLTGWNTLDKGLL